MSSWDLCSSARSLCDQHACEPSQCLMTFTRRSWISAHRPKGWGKGGRGQPLSVCQSQQTLMQVQVKRGLQCTHAHPVCTGLRTQGDQVPSVSLSATSPQLNPDLPCPTTHRHTHLTLSTHRSVDPGGQLPISWAGAAAAGAGAGTSCTLIPFQHLHPTPSDSYSPPPPTITRS